MSDFRIENGELVEYTGKGGDVVIPDSVTSIGEKAFYDCHRLTSISIPDSVTSIGDGAFEGCRNLTIINIPDSVTHVGESAFSGCKALVNRNGFVIIRNVLYNYEGKAKSITIPDNVTSIWDCAFSECSSLTNISIPDSVTSIGDNAFSECESLTSISIPDSVTSIGDNAFSECSSLTNISIPGSVTSIGDNAFSECESLTSISIPDSVTSIGERAFNDCSSLTSISVPDSVTSIEAPAFTECENLQDFTCPSSFAKQLQTILPKTKTTIILYIPDISGMSTKFLLSVVIGFVEDKRDWSDENGKAYAKYIKTKALKLAGLAIEYPALFYLMLREKLISAKDLDAFTKAVQDSGNTELIAAVLDYANSSVSEKDKAKVQQKKETLDTNVTNFLFDAEQIEQISGITFAVTGRLKTFANRNELQACLEACGATLTERLSRDVNYLITNTPDSGTAKNREAESLGISRITEAQFNEMVGRKV